MLPSPSSSRAARRPRVLIIQERLTQYRVPFFEQLRTRLRSEGIDLALVHGRGQGAVASRGDEAELSWAHVVDNRVFANGGLRLVWQPVLRPSSGADLVIVEQASRMAANYWLLARQATGGPRVAFWGHGANLQSDGSWVNRISESAKSRYSRLPHWWFAYTEGSARRVEALGFPAARVTVVQNSVDTGLVEATVAEREPHRAIYVGGLYAQKRLDLLFGTADLVAEELPDFRLTVVGDGPLRDYVEQRATRRHFVDYLGPRFGKELALELKAASLMLMPGAVGLGVLDAFAAGLPVITAAGQGHGPELEYLDSGVNSVIADATPESLAAATRAGLCPSLRAGFELACAESSQRISLSHMVERFTDGIGLAVQNGDSS